jgi:hypothetical protein
MIKRRSAVGRVAGGGQAQVGHEPGLVLGLLLWEVHDP